VPDHVDVRKVDLSIELQILAYHEQRKAQGAQHGLTARLETQLDELSAGAL
jgi:redox-sensing transcriptional repressor